MAGPRLTGPRLTKHLNGPRLTKQLAGPRLTGQLSSPFSTTAGPRLTGPRLTKQVSGPRLTRYTTQTTGRSIHTTPVPAAPAQVPGVDKPVAAQFQEPGPAPTVSTPKRRHFSTTGSLKSVRDSSTIDFAYLPTFEAPLLSHEYASLGQNIPMLPTAISGRSTPDVSDAAISTDVLGPTIHTIAADSTHIHAPSAMSDVHDGAEHHTTDFHDVVDAVAGVRDAARKVTLGLEREAESQAKQAKGIMKTIWTGLVDDVFGASGKQAVKA